MPKRTQATLALIVLVLLLLTWSPELRMFLVFLDAIGVEIFLALQLLQAKHIGYWILAMAKQVERWGWYPMPLPTRAMLKLHPMWAAYAMGQLLVLTNLILMSVAALANSWGSALGSRL